MDTDTHNKGEHDQGETGGMSRPKEMDPLTGLLKNATGNLREGGPDVDYRLLYRYLDPTLGATEADRRKVQENVQTWKSWFRAFWELKLEDDLDEAIEDAKSYPGADAVRLN